MSYINKLRKIKSINTSRKYGEVYSEFNDCVSFIRDTKVIDENKYKIKPSIGSRKIEKLWWVGIFEREFYQEMYSIYDGRKIGASIGYYAGYLFSEDKKKMYLTINQAASGLYKDSIREQEIKFINSFLLTLISPKVSYKTDIRNCLSKNKLNKATDYELGTIVSIEYDLVNMHISDATFKKDLEMIVSDLEIIMNFMLTNKFYKYKDYLIDFKDRLIYENDYEIDIPALIDDGKYVQEVQNSFVELSEEKRNEYNNRKPKYPEGESSSKRIITIPALAKHVLKTNDFKCMIDEEHITFEKNNGDNYMEAHHLVPVKFQNQFGEFCLDQECNIVCICPICHAAIHYGNAKVRLEKLKILYENSKIKDYLKNNKIAKDFNEFYQKFYSQ